MMDHRKMSNRVLLALMGSAILATSAHAGVVVRAPAGAVEGQVSEGVVSFKGLPYAQPPVGEGRWRAPQPIAPWDGVRDASQFGAACIQPISRPGSIYASPLEKIDEDCLFLNIWAPEKAEKAAVIVWIHGGSLVTGAGHEAMYDGNTLASRDAVVVTINYRLGVLGYMAHPELSAENPQNISGNYGLLDQVRALEWVRDNIAAFGGDPENVTIAGESAGALSVMYLMATPKARGLFHKAILQSAYMISTPELRGSTHGELPAEEGGRLLGEKLGRDLAGLRAMDANELTLAAIANAFGPWGAVDGEILTRQLVDTFDRGEQAQVPVLAGYNEGEIRTLRFLAPQPPQSADDYEKAIRARYGDLADEFLRLNPSADMAESVQTSVRDMLYGWTAHRLVKKQTATGQQGFLYYFDHAYPSATAAGLEAFHAAEIPYVFGTFDRTPVMWPRPKVTVAEGRISEALGDYWVSFARSGEPASNNGPQWPAYGTDKSYLLIGDELSVGRDQAPGMYELNEEVVCRRIQQGGIPWNWNVGLWAPEGVNGSCK